MVDVTTSKMARKPVKLQKENPAGNAGEGKSDDKIGNGVALPLFLLKHD